LPGREIALGFLPSKRGAKMIKEVLNMKTINVKCWSCGTHNSIDAVPADIKVLKEIVCRFCNCNFAYRIDWKPEATVYEMREDKKCSGERN
jgi:hypothetical protein